MKLVIRILFLFVVVVYFVSCHENEILGLYGDNNEDFIDNFGDSVDRDFIGKVITEDDFPLSGAVVTIGNTTVTTDNNGIFIAKEASVYNNFAYIKASRAGYFDSSTTLIPTEGVNKATIVMSTNTISQSIASGSQATVSLADGTSIKFDGNFINRDSVAYSGSVSVKLIHLDPADEKYDQKVPAMPYGESTTGQEHFLESYGSLRINLRAEDGSLLFLAKDSPAELTMPINTSLQSVAPNTIKLWYLDYENGYWIEEGNATISGNKYVGMVNHLSYWNFSASSRLINLNFNLSDETDKAVANQLISITNTNTSYPYNTMEFNTNTDGTYNIVAPENRVFDVVVTNNSVCGNQEVFSESINSSFVDRDVNMVITNTTEAMTTSISGAVNDCNNDFVSNGYVFLNRDGVQFFDLLVDGSYDLNLLHCDADTTFSIEAFDKANTQNSSEMSYSFIDPITYLGEVPACNAISEFVQYNIDDGIEEVLITSGFYAKINPFNATYSAPTLTIFDQNTNSRFNVFGRLNDAPSLGIYANWIISDLSNRGLNLGQGMDVSDTNNNITYAVVKLGMNGDYIDLHFQGDYEDTNGVSHDVVGVVHVKSEL